MITDLEIAAARLKLEQLPLIENAANPSSKIVIAYDSDVDENQRSELVWPHGVLGFRMWGVIDNELRAVALSEESWEVGVNRARCLWQKDHLVPDQRCECGLYASHSPMIPVESRAVYELLGKMTLKISEQGAEEYMVVVGAVVGAGRVLVHRDGWRAEQSMPIALIRHPEPRFAGRTEAVAERYQIPVVGSIQELERITQAAAPRAPGELIPSKEEFISWERKRVAELLLDDPGSFSEIKRRGELKRSIALSVIATLLLVTPLILTLLAVSGVQLMIGWVITWPLSALALSKTALFDSPKLQTPPKD